MTLKARLGLTLFTALFALLLGPLAFAQGNPVAGKDYMAISPPQPTKSGDKNEVVEFFWYRCPHCYALEP